MTYLAFFDDDGGCQVEIHVHAPAEEVRAWLTTVADFPVYREPSGTTAWFVQMFRTEIGTQPRIALESVPQNSATEWLDGRSFFFDDKLIAWDVGPWREITVDLEP